MKRVLPTPWLVIIVMLGVCFVFSNKHNEVSAKDNSKKEEIALSACDSWLLLMDSEKYGESWNEAAEYFKNAVTKEQWQKSLNAVRKPLGKLITRTVKSKKYYTSLPGAPDGEYVVVQYETSLEKKKNAIETVTAMKDKDGKWRVSGYYIK